MFALLSVYTVYAQTNRTANLKINDTLPALSFIDMNDQTINIDSVTKGKPMLLVFYKADWCGPCIDHLDELKPYYKSLNIKGIKMYAITTQPVQTMKETITKYGFKFPLLKDEGGASCTRLGNIAAGMPIQTIIITDSKHVVRYIYSSVDLKERPISEDVYQEALRIYDTYK